MLHPVQYVAIDISTAFVHESLERLQQRYPQIQMTALGLDFSNSLDLPDLVRRE